MADDGNKGGDTGNQKSDCLNYTDCICLSLEKCFHILLLKEEIKTGRAGYGCRTAACVNIMKEYNSMYKRQKNRDCGQSGEEETL